MVWTQPKTWTNEPLVAADLNTHLRDNLEALKNRQGYTYSNTSGNYATTSTSLVDIDTTNLNETITLESEGDVLVVFTCTLYNASGGTGYIDLYKDGVSVYEEICGIGTLNNQVVCITVLFEDLPAGDHTFKLRWKTNVSTLQIRQNSNQFVIREV